MGEDQELKGSGTAQPAVDGSLPHPAGEFGAQGLQRQPAQQAMDHLGGALLLCPQSGKQGAK